MLPEIIYEDNHIIVVNKPSGVLSQGDISGADSLLDILKQYLIKKYNKEGEAFVGLVHRLDLPVSGLMVFARTSKAARRLHSEITGGGMDKFYAALVEKEMPAEDKWHRLENYLSREKDVTKIHEKETRFTQKAVLHFRTICVFAGRTLILVKLETGRKHQIRAQLSGINAPICGDKKYGSKTSMTNSICLHSTVLSFTHPTKKERMTFESTLPDNFIKLIGKVSEPVQKRIFESASNFQIMP